MGNESDPPDAWESVVIRICRAIPPGRVSTYGLVAEACRYRTARGGPRQVARMLAQGVHALPWWRIVRADGSLPEHLRAAAGRHYVDEGTALTSRGVPDLAVVLWDPLTDDDEERSPHA